jgi:glycerol kinase
VVVAIDAGTTGVRSFALDEDGRPAGWAYREFPQHFPRPGWVEHDAADIWSAVQETLADLVDQLDQVGQTVAAVGITNQRETAVAWSRATGKPLARAIVWQDRRTAERCEALVEAGRLPLVRERTGLVLDAYFSATKFEWLLQEGGVPAGPDLALGTVDAWVLWNLTAGAAFATDASNASRTLLFDLGQRRWADELCELFGVPPGALPEVRPNAAPFGTTAEGATALGAGIPVTGIAGDQQAALFGQACFAEGMTKNTYGTGSFVLMNVGPTCPPTVEGLLSTVGWELADGTLAYAYEGAIFVTGAAVQWLRDGLGLIASASETESLAARCDDTGGVVIVPAFTGLGSPYWDPYARGTIMGITRGTGRPQLARAVVEAMAFQTRDVVEAMAKASGREITGLRVDGGASVMDLLLRLQADQLGVKVARPVVTETTALGAAYLAGLGCGMWSSLDDVSGRWLEDTEVVPAEDRSAADAAYAKWLVAVERSRDWAR